MVVSNLGKKSIDYFIWSRLKAMFSAKNCRSGTTERENSVSSGVLGRIPQRRDCQGNRLILGSFKKCIRNEGRYIKN